jgi:hypothetical protein
MPAKHLSVDCKKIGGIQVSLEEFVTKTPEKFEKRVMSS